MKPATTSTAFDRLLRLRGGRWALVVIGLLVGAAIVGPMVLGSGSEQLDIVRLQSVPPSWSHPFGTDRYSRDLLARVLNGARISLMVALLSVLFSMTIGTNTSPAWLPATSVVASTTR